MLRFAFLLAIVLAASPAEAVTLTTSNPSTVDNSAEKVDAVTTGVANRARADVAIRRIKTLLVSGESADEGEAIDQIKALQKNLRGEK